MKPERDPLLKKLVSSFKEASELGYGKKASAVAQFYQVLSDLKEKGPAHQVEFDIDFEELPESLREIIEFAKVCFDIQQPSNKLGEYIEKLSELCKRNSHRFLPGAVLLEQEANRWLDFLNNHEKQPAKVILGLSPSLDLDLLENDDYIFSLTNIGQLPAVAVELLVEGDAFTKDEDYNPRISSPIEPNQTRLHSMPLACTDNCEALIKARYKTFPASDGTKIEEETITLPLSIPSELDKEQLGNPYVPDKALTTEDHWENMMQGDHRNVVRDILNEDETSIGRLTILRGLKRTGKTSVLYNLNSEFQKKGFITCYFDFYCRWQVSDADDNREGDSNDGNALLYEIAKVLVKRIEKKNDADDTLSDTFQSQYGQSMRISNNDFKNLCEKLKRKQAKPIIILVDDLDWWIRENKVMREIAIQAFISILELAQDNICTAVFALEWLEDEWLYNVLKKRKYNTSPTYKKIKFLEQDDIKKLARLTLLPFTSASAKLIWKITGGWAGLTQLLFHEIIESIKNDDNKAALIDTQEVRSATNNIFKTRDYEGLTSYLFQSIEKSEVHALRALHDNKAVSFNTSLIDGIRKSNNDGYELSSTLNIDSTDLRNLENKQIIQEPDGFPGRLRLRVGCLAHNVALDLCSTTLGSHA